MRLKGIDYVEIKQIMTITRAPKNDDRQWQKSAGHSPSPSASRQWVAKQSLQRSLPLVH